MCGVIGYIGSKGSPDFLFNGLKRLEYRGYDSAGIAVLNKKNSVTIIKAEGKLINLKNKLSALPKLVTLGIGHTRWATHGKPSEQNAHPHESEQFVLLHNGIIENFNELKHDLLEKGYKFKSETDTEVAVHLLDEFYKKQNSSLSSFEKAKNSIFELVKYIKGAYAFAIICKEVEDTLFVVKYCSPMVIGLGQGENYIASGVSAFLEYTKEAIVLEDRDIAIIKSSSVEILNFDGQKQARNILKIDWSPELLDKNGYSHYMLKEIHETPQAVSQCLADRINRENGNIDTINLLKNKIQIDKIDRIQIIACGTSFYAAQVAKFYMEEFTKIPIEVEIASESRYRTSTVNKNTLAIAVSQSGETIDTLQAIKNSKEHGAMTIALVNAPGSTIAHTCDVEIPLKSGPEVGVASTKAFSAQICSLILVSLTITDAKNKMSPKEKINLSDNLFKIPAYQEKALNLSSKIKEIATQFLKISSILYIGRGKLWPVAMEGALKLKELSYIHAEGYPAGELKHGPIALIDDSMFVLCLCPKDKYYEKTMSNIEEIKARGGKIFAIGTEGDGHLEKISDLFIGIPDIPEMIQPFVITIPLHLFSYWVSVLKGNDVDQPRNLAKSVTVE